MGDTGTVTVGGIAPELAADLEKIAQVRGRPLTLDEVRELAGKAEIVRRAFGGDGAAPPDRDGLLPRSVRVGRVTLHQLTLGARMTLRRLMAWNEAQPGLFDQDAWDTLQAYCFAFARDGEALGRLSSPDQAAAVALEWAHALSVDTAEIAEGLRVLTAVAMPLSRTSGAADEAKVVAGAMERFGLRDPDQVLFGMAEAQLAHLADGAAALDREQAAAVARARGELPPASCDEKADAVGEYQAARRRIVEAETHG